MILQNKTEKHQPLMLDDGRIITVNPYRTVSVSNGLDYNKEIFFEQEPQKKVVVESKNKKYKGENKKW